MNFAERLRAERVRLGFRRQIDFGRLCGVSLPTQSSYETGNRVPDADYLERACAAGADAAFLLTGVRSDPRLQSSEHAARWFAAFQRLSPQARDAVVLLAEAVAVPPCGCHPAASSDNDVVSPSPDE
ncbi:MAG: helix-turn-helix transcriptional regulator [Sphingomonadaceae bacterium]|nr:helix-turn-helix transcriptional regulator [Sphingomonadaceae bacterium]